MPNVTMYSTATCPFCMRARRLLENKGVKYMEIRIDHDPHYRNVMKARSGSSRVPQIFIDDLHIGGFDELSELDIDDRLDDLLGINYS